MDRDTSDMNQENTGEASPANPHALRGPNGVWNEELLAILEWEDALHRIVLPSDLQQQMRVSETVLRWARAKREDVLHVHERDREIIFQINDHLPRWSYLGREWEGRDVWRVLFEVNDRWYAMTIGRDENGSLNLVTVFGSRRRGFVSNRLAGLNSVEVRRR